MSKLFRYIQAQDKVKLVIYLLAFTFFVLINNILGNLFYLIRFQSFYFEISCIHCKVPFSLNAVLVILTFTFCKILLFIWLNTLLKKRNPINIYTSEILISYFLFDLGFIISQIVDVLHLTEPKQLWNFCSSPQTLISPMIGWPFATIVSLIWCFALWKLLKFHSKFNWIYLAKRYFVICFSLLIFNLLRYGLLLGILKPLGIWQPT